MPLRRKLTTGGTVAAVWAALLVPATIYALSSTSLTEVVTVVDQIAINVLHTFQVPATDTVNVGDQVAVQLLHTYQVPQNDSIGIGDVATVSFLLSATTTALSSSANPITYGNPITLTATIVASGTNPGTGAGTVDFKEGTAVLCGAVPLTGNTAACTTKPAAGSHSFTALYSGTSRYTASSGGLTQQVNPAALTVTADNNSRVYGAANPGFTWTITGFVNGETLLTSDVSGNPSCTTTAVPTSPVGAYAINCAIGELTSSNYAFGFAAGSLTVTMAASTTALSSSANPSVFGQPVTFTATVAALAPGAGTPGGSVQFKVDGANLGLAVTLTGGSATSPSLASTVGSHTVTGVYTGDANFSASTSAALTQTVNKAASTTVLTSSVNPSVYGQPVTFTATVAAVAPGAGTPSGTVQFKVDGANLGAAVTLAGGSATSSILTMSVGVHVITTVYNGDSSFTGSTAALNQTVNKAASTTALTSSVNPSVFGQTVTFTAPVAALAPGAGTPGGTVTFNDGSTTLGTGTLNASRIATFSTAALGAGVHIFTAVYGGDANFNGSTSAALSQTVNKADQTITFLPLADDLFGAPAFKVSATSSSGLAVTFTAAGSCSVSGSTVSITGGGSCSITARQLGSADYNPAAPVTRTFNISCFAPQMVFGLPGSSGTAVAATLVFTVQQPLAGGGCRGNFVVNLELGHFKFTIATGTFTATTSGTVATARLLGTVAASSTFNATLILNTATQTGTIVEVFTTEDGPVTITVQFGKVGGVYVIVGVTVMS